MASLRKRGLSDYIILILVTIFTLICVIPFLHIFSVSLSSNTAIINSKVGIVPVDINAEGYKVILKDISMLRSLGFTILLTFLYTAIAMVLSIAGAYALSKRRLKGRRVFMVIIIITMYFSGGIIPDYLLVKSLGMLNKIWCMVLPGAVSAYNLIILRTFFEEIPESLEESAYLDGANDIQVLISIVLPLSAPVLATISLFYAVGRWNGFMDALFYITDADLYPLQYKLYNIIQRGLAMDVSSIEGISKDAMPEGIKSAVIIFSTIPILLVYPKLQKYFIKGVMIGGIKG